MMHASVLLDGFEPSSAPVKFADGTVAKVIGVQVDVTRKTEGACSAFADGAAALTRL